MSRRLLMTGLFWMMAAGLASPAGADERDLGPDAPEASKSCSKRQVIEGGGLVAVVDPACEDAKDGEVEPKPKPKPKPPKDTPAGDDAGVAGEAEGSRAKK
jgi:hypothetical protein